MKWTRYIWILFMIWFVCSARTCDEDEGSASKREEENIRDLKDSVKHVFMSETLSDQLLRACEITAAEKFNDFADYMKIVSDTTLDQRFRQHAADLVRDLFISDEIELYKWSRTCHHSGLFTLELLLTNSFKEGISCGIYPWQINVSEPFTRENDTTYTGSLSFNLKYAPTGSQDSSGIVSGRLEIDIYLIRKLRSFGSEQFRAWEVYLGDINQD